MRLTAQHYRAVLASASEVRDSLPQILGMLGDERSALWRTIGGPDSLNWWTNYELPMHRHALRGVNAVGWSSEMAQFSGRPNPSGDFIDWQKTQAPPDSSALDVVDVVNQTVSMAYSFEAVGLFGLSINQLLQRADNGHLASLIQAASIDRCVLLTPVGQRHLVAAHCRNDVALLKKLLRHNASPHAKRAVNRSLKIVTRIMIDVGDYKASTATERFELIQALGIAAPSDPKEVAGAMRKIANLSTV